MLPCPYFHVTVTVPEQLRGVLRANQQDGYALLMKAAAHAIIDIARDPRFVGGTPGVLTVLHTWTQQLHYHPHVHCLVTGGGVSTGATPCWHPARPSYLAPETAIAKLVCGKLRAWFAQKRPDLIVPATAWTTPWVVRITPLGRGRGGPPQISRALRLSHCHHQFSHRRARRAHRFLPLQASPIQPLAHLHPPWRGVHAPLPAARPAQRPAQGSLFRPLASQQTGHCQQTPPAAAYAAQIGRASCRETVDSA